MVIACTVSEILAQIDHPGPNWTYLTMKMTFRVITLHSYFGTVFILQQTSYMMQECAWCMMQNYLSNNSIKPISWQLINIIPNKLLSDHFWENCQKVTNYLNLTFFWTFGSWKKTTLRAIQSNPSFGQSIINTLLGKLHAKIKKKLLNSFG